MLGKDNLYRAQGIAHEVLRIIKRDRPDAIEELVRSFPCTFDGSTDEHYAYEWCEHLGFASYPLSHAAWAWGLNGGEPAPSNPDDLDDSDSYVLPFIPGESQRAFTRRALAAYHRLGASRFATEPFNTRDVEWLVRFQLGNDSYETIANAESEAGNEISAERVKQVIRELATTLELDLRKGRRGPRRSSQN